MIFPPWWGHGYFLELHNGNKVGGDLVKIKISGHCFCSVNQVVIMLTSLHLHEKSGEVCIKARSPPASLAVIGQVTKRNNCKMTY